MTNNLSKPAGPAPGTYRHYKGGLYEVVGCARHSETLEPMTVYRALYGERSLWVRPAAMFAEQVTINGVLQPRFTPLEPASLQPSAGAGSIRLSRDG